MPPADGQLTVVPERFRDGAWIYLLLVPGLYSIFTHYRRRLAQPRNIEDRIGKLLAATTLSSAGPPIDATFRVPATRESPTRSMPGLQSEK